LFIALKLNHVSYVIGQLKLSMFSLRNMYSLKNDE